MCQLMTAPCTRAGSKPYPTNKPSRLSNFIKFPVKVRLDTQLHVFQNLCMSRQSCRQRTALQRPTQQQSASPGLNGTPRGLGKESESTRDCATQPIKHLANQSAACCKRIWTHFTRVCSGKSCNIADILIHDQGPISAACELQN